MENISETECAFERKYEIGCSNNEKISLTSIYFWTEDSTSKCISNDVDAPHQELFGVTSEKFLEQKEAYDNKNIVEGVLPIKIGNQYYYVAKSPCEDGCGLNYVTYFGDLRVLFNFRINTKNTEIRDNDFWNSFQNEVDKNIQKMNISVN